MRVVQRRQMTRLVISFGVGIILGKITTTAPPADGDHAHRHLAVHRVTMSERRHAHRQPTARGEHPDAYAGLLLPTSIAMQTDPAAAASGGRSARADLTGSIPERPAASAAGSIGTQWPVSTRALKGNLLIPDRAAADQAPQVVAVATTNEPVRPTAVKPAEAIKVRAVAADREESPRAAPPMRVALAEIPPPNETNRSLTTRQREVDALPPIIIGHTESDHEGGDVEDFAAKYQQIRESGRKVEIDGPCVSACTIVASLPKDQVCVTPRAALGVHLASDSDDEVDVQYTDWAVKKYYPKALQDWIETHGGLQEEPKFVRGADLLTIFNACKKST